MIEARCHCGACTIRLPDLPDHLVQCNCSLCRKTGWRGAYFRPNEVTIEGEFDAYVRTDLDEVFLRNMRCRNCGIPTHWEMLGDPPHSRVGVNANLMEPGLLEGIEVRQLDGASW